MPSSAVDTAFKTKLHQSWTVSPVVGGIDGVLPETITEPPQGYDAFLVVQYPVVTGEKPVLHGRYFEDGAARLVLNVKREIGQTQSLSWAGTLAGLFRDFKSDDVAGFETFVPSGPIVNDAIDDANWVEYAVIVPYRYQFSA